MYTEKRFILKNWLMWLWRLPIPNRPGWEMAPSDVFVPSAFLISLYHLEQMQCTLGRKHGCVWDSTALTLRNFLLFGQNPLCPLTLPSFSRSASRSNESVICHGPSSIGLPPSLQSHFFCFQPPVLSISLYKTRLLGSALS